MLALYYCLGVVGVFAVFLGLGSAIAWGARRVTRPRQPELALAIGNLGAPGGLTRSVVLSLGAGLSLLVTVALVDRSIVAELTEPAARGEPQLLRARHQALRDRRLPRARRRARRRRPRCSEAPMLRGRLVKLGDRAGRAGQGAAGGAVGAQRRSRPVLLRDRAGGLQRRRRPMVAGRLRRRAAGLLRGRDRQGPRASRSATPSRSTCSAATSRRASPTCAR